jgi:hypothetical protein
MPYIKMDDRIRAAKLPETPGELNYALTTLCVEYLAQAPESYGMYNSVIGALECCKLELYRRRIASYETNKWCENGDVY